MSDSPLALLERAEALQKIGLPATLSGLDLHVWGVDLVRLEGSLPTLEPLLGSEERQRAERFATAFLRNDYVLSHAALRLLLSHHTTTAADALHFTYSGKGKPAIAEPAPARRVRFSLSHSGGLALVAVAPDRDVGVDLERICERTGLAEIARAFLGEAEQALLRAGSSPQAAELFHRLWTRKEAVLKASGHGITASLREPDVSAGLLDANQGRALEVQFAGNAWLVADLAVRAGYAAAVAVRA